jgi:hypothetical protein
MIADAAELQLNAELRLGAKDRSMIADDAELQLNAERWRRPRRRGSYRRAASRVKVPVVTLDRYSRRPLPA